MPDAKVVFFDVDGTLIHGNTWDGLLHHPQLRGYRRALLQLSTAPRYALFRAYLLSYSRYLGGRIRGIAGLLRGYSPAELDLIFAWLVEDFLADEYRQDVVFRLEQHVAQGDHVVLISAFFEQAIQHMAARLQAHAVIATSLELRSGVATGRIRGKVCVGPRRLDFIRTYLASYNPALTLSDCIAYADNYTDAPMMGAVGQAIAVYPDRHLLAAALEQGWQMVAFPPPRPRKVRRCTQLRVQRLA
ncbi:MAG: HAD-IB family hydrolase [Anaerolineae bacterium]|nr:HAD-IB family hydrolase [Anaerolineae bacterium]